MTPEKKALVMNHMGHVLRYSNAFIEITNCDDMDNEKQKEALRDICNLIKTWAQETKAILNEP